MKSVNHVNPLFYQFVVDIPVGVKSHKKSP